MDLSLVISKGSVLDEVAQTTSYAGSKMMKDDPGAYDRIFTTEADRSQLERFWNESCAGVTEALMEFVEATRNDESGLVLELHLSASFERSLEEAFRRELFSYMVSYISGKWFGFTNKPEAGAYLSEAAILLDGAKRKIYFRRKPRRPKKQYS